MDGTKEDRKEACRTYIEQTKLLVTLSSAFLIPPAAIFAFASGSKKISIKLFIVSEILFVFSILAGYFVMGTIAGSQDKGEYDVYRLATRIFSWLQIILYIGGLITFIFFIRGVK